MDIIEKMHSTKLYLPSDPEIAKEQQKCLNRLYDFNQTRPTELKKREAMLYRAAVPRELGRQTCSLWESRLCKFQPNAH